MADAAKDIVIMELRDTIADLRGIISTLQDALAESKEQNAILAEKVDYLTRKLFGTSREKTQMDGQLSFFDEEQENGESAADSLPPISIASHTRKPKTRFEEKIKGLPVEEIEFSLHGDDCKCPYCNGEMEAIGRKLVRKEVEFIPAKAKVLEYYSVSYGCPACKEDGAACIVSAPVPKALMKHSSASPSTVAWVMYQKYHNGMSLYRQQDDWRQTGFELSRATMAKWVIHCSERYLKPLYDYCQRLLVKREFAMADETRIQVLKEPGRKARTDSFMWVFRSGEDRLPPIIIYKYSETRAGKTACDVLAGFHGYLMADAFSRYMKVKNVKLCICFAHLRRYFYDAIPKGMNGDLSRPAVQGVNYMDEIFRHESDFKEQGLTVEQIYENRLKYEKPVIDAFNAWVDKQHPSRGSKLDKAITYAINRRDAMETYLEDGRCSLSNNLTEQLLKAFVTRRKGWLFADSVAGANASAIVYSIAHMAKANELNVFEYIKHLLTCRPHDNMADDELDKLLPWNPDVMAKCGLR